MKNFIYLLTISSALICSSLNAQWTPQVVLLPEPFTVTLSISPVDSNIVWTLSADLTNGGPEGDPIGPMNRFTRTTNGGTTWLQDTISGAKGLHPGGITAIDSMTAWVAMQDESLITSGGIFKTTDGGAIWTKQTTAFNGPGGKPMFIHFFDADTGLLVGERTPGFWEIYTTNNGGEQWDSVPLANIPPKQPGEKLRVPFEFSVFHNTFWFCTSGPAGRVFKSTNRGHEWTVAAVGIGYDRIHSVAFQDDSVGLACAFMGKMSTIVKSTNGGKTWFPVATPVVPTPHIISYVPGTTGTYVVVAHPWYGTNTGTAITTDAGSTWTTLDRNAYGLLAFVAPNIGWAIGENNAGSYSIFRWSGNAIITSIETASGGPYGKISLYPNPAQDILHINLAGEAGTLEVFDISGKSVLQKEIGENNTSVDVSGLDNGIYFVKVLSDNHLFTEKFVKN